MRKPQTKAAAVAEIASLLKQLDPDHVAVIAPWLLEMAEDHCAVHTERAS